jgi:DNA-binding MurR/RpiR family transcriptional regulator
MKPFRFQTDDISLTKSELTIIDYIYRNLSNIPFVSINQLAEELDISVATLSRFVRHLGFESFKDLKTSIAMADSISPATKLNSTLSSYDSDSLTGLLSKEIESLIQTQKNLSDKEVENAVIEITQSDTIFFFGKGASRSLCELFSFRLNRFLKKTVILHSSGSELFENLPSITTGDLVIIYGFHKMPVEAKVLLEYCKDKKIPTLLFTDRLYETPEYSGSTNLYVYRGEAKEYHSMTAPVAVIDSIIIKLAKKLEDTSLKNLDTLYQLKEKYKNVIPR